MKKLIYLACIVAVVTGVAACGSKEKKGKAEEIVANEAVTEKPADVDPIAMGEALVKKNDCKTCHHATNKAIGPPHMDVAKKYEFTKANVEMLAQKIMKGGSGVWGQVQMSAHPDLSQADAERMARYVLSLDGEKEH